MISSTKTSRNCWSILVKPKRLHELLDEVLKTRDSEEVVVALENLRGQNAPEATILTIIANAGVHEIPKAYLRGEVYEASRGDWDAKTEEALLLELSRILRSE